MFDRLYVQYALKLRNLFDNLTYDVTFSPQYGEKYNRPMAIRCFCHRIEADLAVVCPQFDSIQSVCLLDEPPWTIKKSRIDYFLTHFKNDFYSSHYLVS